MSENDKLPSRLTQKESYIGKQHPDNKDENTNPESPYPNQEQRDGADNEQYIINNARGNGINPTSLKNGREPEWIDGRQQKGLR